MPSRSVLRSVPAEILRIIQSNARHFPAQAQQAGRTLLQEGRVGPVEVSDSGIRATVRDTHHYRAAWIWNGAEVDPQCSCPASPLCAHALALARAIEALRPDGTPPPRTAGQARASRRGAIESAPADQDRHRSSERHDDRTSADLARDLTRWARRRRETPPQALSLAFGIDATGERPCVWIEARLSSPKRGDAPRTQLQLLQLTAAVSRDPNLMAPPHLRLLRLLASIVPRADALPGGARFVVRSSAIIRLLDSFANSALVRWDTDAGAAAKPGGVTAGAKLRLGDTPIDIVPVSSGDAMDLSITLAARWPDGRLARLDDALYLPTDDDLHPSLVLIDGTFWCVGEEPPPHVIRKLTQSGGLRVPEKGREQFLGLLASSFSSVADALAPHMRVYRARPVLTFDLDDDDWMHVRLFAHTGGAPWQPGAGPSPEVAFELGANGEWLRIGPDAAEPVRHWRALGDTAGSSADPPLTENGTAHGLASDSDAFPDRRADDAVPEGTVWVEVPEPGPIEPAREWLQQLPLVRRNRAPGPGRIPGTPHHDRGAWIRVTARSLERLTEAWAERPEGVTYLGTERVQALLGGRHPLRPCVTVTASGTDWFTVSAEWRAEGLALTAAELAKLRASRRRFVKLESGWMSRDWLAAHDAASEILADLGLEAGEGEQRLSLMQLAQARPESLAALIDMTGDPRSVQELEQLRERVRSFTGLPRVPVPEGLRATLRPYQRDGLDFLAFVTDLGLGAVVADDMGLGKTVQALAWVERMRARDPQGGPVLVVCPASVVHNWLRESGRFTPHLRVLTLTSGDNRHALRRQVPQYDLVVTNFALLQRDIEHWRPMRLRAAIVDEAQNIKNPATAISRAVQSLDARHRLALTGTPIENRALDLWSIMQFVNPGYLGRRQAFVARYDRPDSPAHARRLLAARLRPVMVRRLKETVATDLPDRIEERRECQLTPGQRKLYLAELMHGREMVAQLRSTPDGLARNRIAVLAALTRLRQICCHPALAGGREDLGSGKFDALFEILEPLLAEGRKVLVFSQFVECLKLLEADMNRRGIRHHMLTGSTTRREQVVRAFEQDPEPCVFMISLKAGGTGLNLTAAQYVVLFDPWWNPAVEAQAIDRAHRIGQTRTVIAYRMLAEGTIEEKIWELQKRKQALASDVLGEDGFARSLSADDLDYLLT